MIRALKISALAPSGRPERLPFRHTAPSEQDGMWTASLNRTEIIDFGKENYLAGQDTTLPVRAPKHQHRLTPVCVHVTSVTYVVLTPV